MNKIILCFLCFFSVKAFSQCDLYLDAFKNGCDTSCTFYLEAIPSGVQPYSFQWSNQNFPDTFRLYNVCPGMYYCTFTDNNGCTSFDSIFLPTAPSFNLNLSYTEPSCPGCADGYASVNPEGTCNNYMDQYLWSNMSTTEQANGLECETYSVSVWDCSYCMISDTFELCPNSTESNKFDFDDVKIIKSNDYLFIESNKEIINISITNSLGQILFNKYITDRLTPIDLKLITSDVIFISIYLKDERIIFRKFIME